MPLLNLQPGSVRLHDSLLDVLDALPDGEPMARSVASGWVADRMGVAFLAGYRAALEHLVGPGVQALAVTEAGGGHPRAIETSIHPDGDELVVSGRKQWCTGADLVTGLLVIGSTGLDAAGRKRLRAVEIPADAVRLESMPTPPFAPEIGHCIVHLDAVRVPLASLGSEDAWTTVVKPFRTVEDLHVMAALAGHGAGLAHLAHAPGLVEAGLLWIAALTELAGRPPLQPDVHLALSALLPRLVDWFASVVEVAPESRRADLQRDLALFGVGRSAREARTRAARAALGISGSDA